MPLAMKAQWTLTAGILPGEPMPEFTKQWSYTNVDHKKDQGVPSEEPTIYSEKIDEVYDLAKGMCNPGYVNWVKVEFIWL